MEKQLSIIPLWNYLTNDSIYFTRVYLRFVNKIKKFPLGALNLINNNM